MHKIIIFILLFPLCSFALRTKPYTEGYQWVADKCRSIQCTEENIEIIDNQISLLIAKRLAYVRRGAQLKSRDVRVPNTPRSTEEALQGVKGRATYQGYNPDVAKGIFKEINEQSRAYEQQILDKNKRN